MASVPPLKLCLVPRLQGLGGVASFQARLAAGLDQRGIAHTFDFQEEGVTTILVTGGTRQIASLWQARRRGLRIVQRLNGMNWIHRRRFTSLRHYLRSEANNLILATIRRRLAHHIVYQSQFSRDWWQRVYGPDRISHQVTYNGIDLARYHPDGPHERPADHLRLLLVEGRLGDGGEVGLENAVQLTELLRQNYHLPVRLMVVGKTPSGLRQQYQARAGGCIDWQGVVSRDEIPAIDRSAHLFFSADLNAACPNAVIEALACGLPVAALDTGALREMVQGDAGRVVPYGSNHWQLEPPVFPPLAQAAVEILTENARFRQAARRHAEAMFGLDQMIDGYLTALAGEG